MTAKKFAMMTTKNSPCNNIVSNALSTKKPQAKAHKEVIRLLDRFGVSRREVFGDGARRLQQALQQRGARPGAAAAPLGRRLRFHEGRLEAGEDGVVGSDVAEERIRLDDGEAARHQLPVDVRRPPPALPEKT